MTIAQSCDKLRMKCLLVAVLLCVLSLALCMNQLNQHDAAVMKKKMMDAVYNAKQQELIKKCIKEKVPIALCTNQPHQQDAAVIKKERMDVVYNEKQQELTKLIKKCAEEKVPMLLLLRFIMAYKDTERLEKAARLDADPNSVAHRKARKSAEKEEKYLEKMKPLVRDCGLTNIKAQFSKELNEMESLRQGVDFKVAECITKGHLHSNCIMEKFKDKMRKLEVREQRILLLHEKVVYEKQEHQNEYSDVIGDQGKIELIEQKANQAADKVDKGFGSVISACGQDPDCVADSIRAAVNETIDLVNQEQDAMLNGVSACCNAKKAQPVKQPHGNKLKVLTGCIIQHLGQGINARQLKQ